VGLPRRWIRRPGRKAIVLALGLAVVPAVELGIGLGRAGARATGSSSEPLDVLKIDPNSAVYAVGRVKLEKGHPYLLKVSGAVVVNGSSREDALYRYAPSRSRSALLRLQTPGYTNLYSPIDAFQHPTPDQSCQPFTCPEALPYSGNHEYDVVFYPPTTGPLHAGTFNQIAGQFICDHCYKVITPLTVEVFGGSEMTWAMPDRFGPKGENGLIRYLDTYSQIHPKHWPVDMTLRTCDQRKLGSYEWTVDGTPPDETAIVPHHACTVAVDVGTLGPHQVVAKAPDGTESSTSVVARDFLVFGLGDSNGSGEGTPDIPGLHVRWEDLRCDRSAKSYEAKAALAIEQRDKHSSVTFVHLACSGATVVNGLLGPYEGINPPEGEPPLASQFSQLGKLVGKREVDAVIISIGVNDLRFGPMTGFCIEQNNCPYRKYPDAHSPTTLDEWMREHVAMLPGLYDDVAARLAQYGIPPNRVYISQYFDSTRDQNGVTCNPLIEVHTPLTHTFSQSEAAWAYSNVLVPLNDAVAAAAARHGWRLISGAQQAFRKHGYCSTDSWITTLTESFSNQHDKNGTLHANETGQVVDSKLALRVLEPDLLPGGKPRQAAR
jgi:GDSL-like lipase/acylhydrolase family protein